MQTFCNSLFPSPTVRYTFSLTFTSFFVFYTAHGNHRGARASGKRRERKEKKNTENAILAKAFPFLSRCWESSCIFVLPWQSVQLLLLSPLVSSSCRYLYPCLLPPCLTYSKLHILNEKLPPTTPTPLPSPAFLSRNTTPPPVNFEMPPSNSIPHLQLPILTPLEPLTTGTNLPHVPAEELTPTSTSSSNDGQKPPATPSNLEATTTAPSSTTTPPQSPGRPTSMRRFLSRVSLNSSYHGEDDDKASVLSGPLSPTGSVMSRDSKRKTTGSIKSRTSWWKKSKTQTVQEVSPSTRTTASASSLPQRKQTVQSIAPPPKLPDDLFGNGFSSLDSDMFKNFK